MMQVEEHRLPMAFARRVDVDSTFAYHDRKNESEPNSFNVVMNEFLVVSI